MSRGSIAHCWCRRAAAATLATACQPNPTLPSVSSLQTQPRPHKRRKSEAEQQEEEEEQLAQEEFVPAGMTNRILKEARAQQEELEAEAAPAAAAALAAGGARGLVAAAAKGLRDSDSEDEFSGASWLGCTVFSAAGCFEGVDAHACSYQPCHGRRLPAHAHVAPRAPAVAPARCDDDTNIQTQQD